MVWILEVRRFGKSNDRVDARPTRSRSRTGVEKYHRSLMTAIDNPSPGLRRELVARRRDVRAVPRRPRLRSASPGGSSSPTTRRRCRTHRRSQRSVRPRRTRRQRPQPTRRTRRAATARRPTRPAVARAGDRAAAARRRAQRPVAARTAPADAAGAGPDRRDRRADPWCRRRHRHQHGAQPHGAHGDQLPQRAGQAARGQPQGHQRLPQPQRSGQGQLHPPHRLRHRARDRRRGART